MRRIASLFLILGLLSACARDDLTVPPEAIGNFEAGHLLAVAPDPQLGPFSRRAEDGQWVEAMQKALEDRFRDRFPGDRTYHIGVAVEAYVLALPGIPLVYSPKSVLIFSVNFYDDATRTRLNPEPIQLTVFEACCTVPILGSGLTKTKEEQMEALSFNAARAVERTMRQNAQWFGGAPEALAADDTIRAGNVLEDDPDFVAPPETAPGGS